MKINLLLSLMALALSYGTCKNFRKTPEAAPQPQPVDQSKRGQISHNAAHVFDGSHPDSAYAVQVQAPPRHVDVPIDALPAPTASHKAYLSTGWWHLNMALSPTDSTVYRHYKDRFMKFREDQTFDIIHQGKVVESGRWNWDRDLNEIYLSCSNPYINNTWKVTDKGFVMIWKGNTALNVTGIQIR
ncbi:MAG TPA: hypothetical protein PKD78_08110, partial [Saprospiraceae bacterium]|nr:hypothetical protein [Saprospiraceae bacterium]